MPCVWPSCTNREIVLTRLRRRIHRLEQRLSYLRRSRVTTELYRDTVIVLEAELASLKSQLE